MYMYVRQDNIAEINPAPNKNSVFCLIDSKKFVISISRAKAKAKMKRDSSKLTKYRQIIIHKNFRF